jgi:hypothetical protein
MPATGPCPGHRAAGQGPQTQFPHPPGLVSCPCRSSAASPDGQASAAACRVWPAARPGVVSKAAAPARRITTGVSWGGMPSWHSSDSASRSSSRSIHRYGRRLRAAKSRRRRVSVENREPTIRSPAPSSISSDRRTRLSQAVHRPRALQDSDPPESPDDADKRCYKGRLTTIGASHRRGHQEIATSTGCGCYPLARPRLRITPLKTVREKLLSKQGVTTVTRYSRDPTIVIS